MKRAGLFIPLFLVAASACGQWTIGPRADAALFPGHPRYLAAGIGTSSTYQPGKRGCWTADASFHLPHSEQIAWSTGPRNLATGDTTSSTGHGKRNTTHALLLLGYQRTFNRRQRPAEWHWKMASGIAVDRTRERGDVQYTYSGERIPMDRRWHDLYIPLLTGGGHIWHLGHADLAVETAGIFPVAAKSNGTHRSFFRDCSLYLAVHYRWRV
jgi:hypothetical protein